LLRFLKPKGVTHSLNNSTDLILYQALEAIPLGIAVFDGAGKIVAVNSNLSEVFGVASHEVRGYNLERLLREKGLPPDHPLFQTHAGKEYTGPAAPLTGCHPSYASTHYFKGDGGAPQIPASLPPGPASQHSASPDRFQPLSVRATSHSPLCKFFASIIQVFYFYYLVLQYYYSGLDHRVCSLIHFCVHRGLSPLHAYKLFASIIWYYSTIIRALLIVDTKMSTRKTESPRPEVGSLRDMGTTADRQTTLSSHLFR
jgi:hypothetical protein